MIRNQYLIMTSTWFGFVLFSILGFLSFLILRKILFSFLLYRKYNKVHKEYSKILSLILSFLKKESYLTRWERYNLLYEIHNELSITPEANIIDTIEAIISTKNKLYNKFKDKVPELIEIERH